MSNRKTSRARQPLRIESNLNVAPTIAKWEVDLLAHVLGKMLCETADRKEGSRDPRS